MNKAISFVRLDFITIKPYLTAKNLLLFVGVALIMLIVNNSPAGAIGLLMSCAALYASYPFAVGEKSNIDVLYTTLSIKRETVVLGRYLFAMIIDILAGFFTFIFSFAVQIVRSRSFDTIEALATVSVLFMVFSIIQAAQLPVYFKLGYTKAKFIAYIPFVVLPLAILAGSNFLFDYLSSERLKGMYEWLAQNTLWAALTGVMLWLVFVAVSYLMSLSFYKKREF